MDKFNAYILVGESSDHRRSNKTRNRGKSISYAHQRACSLNKNDCPLLKMNVLCRLNYVCATNSQADISRKLH
jgi:hypothetical protein